MMDAEIIWQVALIIAVALFLIAAVAVMVLYRLSNEYKRRHPDRYFYDPARDEWVRRKRK